VSTQPRFSFERMIELAAQSAINTLTAVKSQERCETVYKYLEKWMQLKKIREVSENVVREAKTILLTVSVYLLYRTLSSEILSIIIDRCRGRYAYF
jgi:hypothetical protein